MDIRVKRMSAHIKSKQFFLVGKFFVIAPWRDHTLPGGRGVRLFVEQRNLANGPIPQRGRRAGKRFVDAGKKLRAIAADKIERAGFNQTLEHFAIRDPRSDSSAKIL